MITILLLSFLQKRKYIKPEMCYFKNVSLPIVFFFFFNSKSEIIFGAWLGVFSLRTIFAFRIVIVPMACFFVLYPVR